MDSRRIAMTTLAVLTLLAPVGCRRWLRPCNSTPRTDVAPDDRDRDFDPGYIPPRGSTIPAPGVPARPDGGRRDTYTPTRPAPRLESPIEPYSPPGTFGSPFELPRPYESRSQKPYERPVESESKKFTDPALPKNLDVPSESIKPKKVLVPERMPDTPEKAPEKLSDNPSEAKKTPLEGTKPVPDRNVFLDPVAPGGPFDLPGSGPKVEEEREPLKRDSKASPKPDTPPVGLSDFQLVKGKSNVASGVKPTLDGYEWLAKSGYKTVVYAHEPKADVTAVKAVCEAAGLKFVGIPTGPATIPDATAAFDAAVQAKDGPVYVCDDSGLRAGTLWYAHFRKVDLTNPDTAKVRANGLGMGDTATNPTQKELFDAVQRHLDSK